MVKFLKIFLGTIFLLVLLAAGCIFYAFKIEPYRITANEVPLNETSSNPLKVVQFSDTHIKEDFTAEHLVKVVTKINEQAPDVVVFTGDLYDNYAEYHDDVNVMEALRNINAKYAKIAIWGNRDYGGGAARQYEDIMAQAGFTVLKNGNWYITTDTGQKILFTGLDDSMLGNASMPHSTKIYKSDYDILLTHEPDAASVFQETPYDFILSGHSHGGQVNIPFLPAINERAVSSTSLATNYVGGMYQFSEATKMYVNTGIGTTHISVRFGVVPEISVFTIYL